MATEPPGTPKDISAAVQEIAERAQLLVREEIELARVEVTQKVTKILKGAVIGLVAGVFALAALLFGLHGLSWLLWYVIPFPNGTYFWGFFIVAALLLGLGGMAGFLAARFLRRGTPPKPELAIEEAQRIRETVSGSSEGE